MKDHANKNKRGVTVYITMIVDLILLVVFMTCLLLYTSKSEKKSFNQNVENTLAIAESNSQLLQRALDNTSDEVIRAYNYCNGKTKTEILDYLSCINGLEEEYQLLSFDEEGSGAFSYNYVGYSTKKEDGNYTSVEYLNTSLTDSISKYNKEVTGEVSFTQSFTNQTDALRYFGVFCGIDVNEGSVIKNYYLLKLQKESKVLSYVQTNSRYDNIAVAICYNDGKYLAYDEVYRSNNFFDYLLRYNNLSLDEKNEIIKNVQDNEKGSGTLFYNDYRGNKCVFAYAVCGEEDQLITVVSVPEAEFVSERLITLFPWIIIGFLGILLIFNILMLLSIVIKLRISVEHEQLANTSKTSFLSRISHEIRTPLNAVIGYNEIARDEISSCKNEIEKKQADMKVLDCLIKSEIASKQLLSVINDVLDMSSIESGKIKIQNERFDFKGLITSLTMVFYSQAKMKKINFEVTFDPSLDEWVIGDQVRTNQILTNLLSNAIKFTNNGGNVELRISLIEKRNSKSFVCFEVIDNGIGMPEEYMSKIWAPFEQADATISRRFGGTGLGLTITKTLVDLMKGKISVNSTLGKGTTFNVEIPYGNCNKNDEINSSYDFKKINALIVDDDESTCDYISSMFNRCGARCLAVRSGFEAIEAIEQSISNKNYFTMCLVDWQMPKMDGIETIKRIKDFIPNDLPIIVISAYDYSEIAEKVKDIGINHFVSKPLFQSNLFDLLADICGRKEEIVIEKQHKISFNGSKVLLVEDNLMNIEIAKRILESAGLTVECAFNGKEAVDLFEKSENGKYQAILMDIHMPEIDGLEATRLIRNSSNSDAKTIPIIAMTADAFIEDIAESKRAGMNDHISKPINTKILLATLQRFIKK